MSVISRLSSPKNRSLQASGGWVLLQNLSMNQPPHRGTDLLVRRTAGFQSERLGPVPRVLPFVEFNMAINKGGAPPSMSGGWAMPRTLTDLLHPGAGT